MKLTIVYDNEKTDARLMTGWGFASFLELDNSNILFDTGWDGSTLLNNIEILDLDPLKIEKVVLSHEHWDHIGGLTHLLNINKNLKIYVPKSISKRLKSEISVRAELIEINEPTEIADDCFSTGELGSRTKEQSLIIKTKKGPVVVTGCAHPGLEKIISGANMVGNIHSIIGGFHSFKKYELLKDIPIIIPTHCTFHKQEIAKIYPDAFKKGGAGYIVEV